MKVTCTLNKNWKLSGLNKVFDVKTLCETERKKLKWLVLNECQVHDVTFAYMMSFYLTLSFKYLPIGTSLVVQWLRIRLPMQGTQV